MRTTRNIPGFMVALPEMVNQLMNDEYFKPTASHKMPYIPKVNLRETSEIFEIELAVPGFEKEDFKIKSEGGKLSISAEIAEKQEATNENYTIREFSCTSFERSFVLPKNKVNEEAILANYDKGILKITLPKLEEAKPKEAKTIAIS